MQISKSGIGLIKEFEGLRLEAYQCVAGVWTIGYGHVGKDIYPGLRITVGQAEVWLRQDLARFELAVNRQVKVELNQNQFDALVSWCYNLGETNLANSSMLKKLNNRDYAAVPDEMRCWCKVGGKELPGLLQRRKIEADIFASPCREVIGAARVNVLKI